MSLPARSSSQLSACRDVLEQVLLELPSLPPRVDRTPMVSLLGRGLDVLTQLSSGSPADPEHIGQIGAACAAMTGCAAILRVVAPREVGSALIQRLGLVERALDTYRRETLATIGAPGFEAPRAPPSAMPLRASVGVPALHRIARGPLTPHARVRSDADEGSREEGALPATGGDPAAVLLFQQLRRTAYDCFSELGSLGNLREAGPDLPWTPELRRFEQRLLADLDALVALATPVVFDGTPCVQLDMLGELLAYAADAMVPDPGRAFAQAFVLGCVEGEDAVRAAVVALRQSDPTTHEAQRSALSLASNPMITRAMEALALREDAALAVVALDVLRARRTAAAALAAPLVAHPEPRVRRSAALFLGVARERGPAIALLRATLDDDPEETVRAAAAESLVRLGSRAGLSFARARIEEGARTLGASGSPVRKELLRLVALAGGPSDAIVLHQELALSPSEAAVETIGLHGHPGSVERLALALKEACSPGGNGAEALREPLCRALHGITGMDVIPTSDGVRTFEGWWRERRSSFGSPEVLRLEGATSARRYRLGRPYTPLESLDALTTAAPVSVRKALALEVAGASRGELRLGTEGWIAQQMEELASARQEWTRVSARWAPGDWLERHLG
ncbi:hypothetical protein [Chondromyces crocatus]|uniref:HEAT repeat domain-containing protein n=1 Tax=Chondromyces crocatus TaxID=52 RepID=A0A0K1EBW1_CHOCO|nr:hypothetical protein [Chondromyces crocatus]AKT38162.1 uncharacterized protein CMC5_023050 [Chondromyces crocatus]